MVAHPAGIIGYLPPIEDGCKFSKSCLCCPFMACEGDPNKAVDNERKQLIVRALKKGKSPAQIEALCPHLPKGLAYNIQYEEGLYGIRHPGTN